MVRILRSAAAIALLTGAALVAQAAGLGKLTVNSALGQILNAEIDLVSLQPGEVDSLSARVASASGAAGLHSTPVARPIVGTAAT